ncbi:MAG TPA: hypothetical protein PKE31_09090 [Pseudomonadota bacterium]|nr:hypothetical protein [Pseudomonadota bacterium]
MKSKRMCLGVLLPGLWMVTLSQGLSCSNPSTDQPPDDPGVCTDCTPTGTQVGRLPSPSGMVVWTAPTTEKILREAAPPTTTAPSVQLYAAKNEFEPFQIAVRADAAGSVKLSMPAFPAQNGGEAISRIEIRRVGYVKITTPSDASSLKSTSIPDPLTLSQFGNAETVPTSTKNFTVAEDVV